MASSQEYLNFIMGQLNAVDGVSYRAMMGEYIIYYNGKVIGGIYDDRFLVKNTPTAARLCPRAELVLPYEKGSLMIQVDDVDNREFLRTLFEAMYDELPLTKKRKGSSLH